jgi:phospholipase C
MAGRTASTLPFPQQAPGTVNEAMPFDHMVVVMMENHSFDNLLGALPGVDGLTFDAGGTATNTNPGARTRRPMSPRTRYQIPLRPRT